MFHGVLALLGRSLRVDARSLRVHLARAGLMLAIYAAFLFALYFSNRFGAPGLRVFRILVWLNAIFASLLSIGYFSTSISEEKEEDTLGLMQMAGISPVGILLGKVGGRVWQTLLLIAVQYPFTLLAVTMGGVTTSQVWSAFVGIGACIFLFSGMGLLCSTMAPRNRTASSLMTLGIALYIGIPVAAAQVLQFWASNGLATGYWPKVLAWLESTCLFLRIETILTSGFGESAFCTQVFSNVGVGAVCYLISWAVFDICTRNSTTAATATRGLVARQRGKLRWFAPGRPWRNPFVWNGFYFVGGGIAGVMIRFTIYLLIWGAAVLIGEFQSFRMSQGYTVGMFQFLALIAVTLDLAIVASRTTHEEVHGQTLQSLVMLPGSLTRVVYAKLAGSMLPAMAGIGFLAFSLQFKDGWKNVDWYFNEHAGWFFLAHFILIPHLATTLGMHLRWGYIPLSIGLAVGSTFGWVGFFESAGIGPGSERVWFGTLPVLAISVACHFWMTRMLPRIAARS